MEQALLLSIYLSKGKKHVTNVKPVFSLGILNFQDTWIPFCGCSFFLGWGSGPLWGINTQVPVVCITGCHPGPHTCPESWSCALIICQMDFFWRWKGKWRLFNLWVMPFFISLSNPLGLLWFWESLLIPSISCFACTVHPPRISFRSQFESLLMSSINDCTEKGRVAKCWLIHSDIRETWFYTSCIT